MPELTVQELIDFMPQRYGHLVKDEHQDFITVLIFDDGSGHFTLESPERRDEILADFNNLAELEAVVWKA